METETNAEGLERQGANRRSIPRFDVDENAQVLLVNHGSTLSCRIVDLSLGGCRIRTNERFQAGVMVRVEVSFKVRGLAFRFSGVSQWTNAKHLVGIRFLDVTSRRREELAEALGEVKEENAAKAAKAAEEQRAAEKLAADEEALERLTWVEQKNQALSEALPDQAAKPQSAAQDSNQIEDSEFVPQSTESSSKDSLSSLDAQPELGKQPVQPVAAAVKQDRRAQARQDVDTSAIIFLVKIASKINGRILDLSLGGCRIHTEDRFPVGIYTRVETEFRLEGLPFRLAGVVQAIHDRQRQNVGIRFLDMSDRKREQLEQLIEEIQEMRKSANGEI